MKKIVFLLISLFILTSTIDAQKVKLKKNAVLVDKKKMFTFEKTRDGKLLKNILPHFSLNDLDGKEILVFTDKMVYYESLPNETDKRLSYGTFVCTSPQNEKSTVIGMPRALNSRKYFLKELNELSFFKSGEMTSQLYDDFIATQNLEQVKDWEIHTDTTNTNRIKNYELTKNKFGDLKERKPGLVSISSIQGLIIKDGATSVGEIKVIQKGSYSHSYKVLNHEGVTIATIAIILREGRGNVRTLSDEKRKWFHFKTNRDGSELSLEDKLELFAEYLILQGYL